MARNEEKSQSMLNRFLARKSDELLKSKGNSSTTRRPYLASDCLSLPDAERFRHQIIREISKKVDELQNTSLPPAVVRDLNDVANKLLREKKHWERRIVELGGMDYKKTAPKVTEQEKEGAEIPGGKGYRYFGAAKLLPGVKDLLDIGKRAGIDGNDGKRKRGEMVRLVDGDYYGYRDDDDGVLRPLEAASQRKVRENLIAAWENAEEDRLRGVGEVAGPAQEEHERQLSIKRRNEGRVVKDSNTGDPQSLLSDTSYLFRSHVVGLPSASLIASVVLERKKAQLMATYGVTQAVETDDSHSV